VPVFARLPHPQGHIPIVDLLDAAIADLGCRAARGEGDDDGGAERGDGPFWLGPAMSVMSILKQTGGVISEAGSLRGE
jgi:hypothetical protein